jgi:hypothetical protein
LPRLGLATPLRASRRFKSDDVIEAFGLRIVSGESAAGELLPTKADLSHTPDLLTEAAGAGGVVGPMPPGNASSGRRGVTLPAVTPADGIAIADGPQS